MPSSTTNIDPRNSSDMQTATGGVPIHARDYVTPWTGFHVGVGWIALFFAGLFFIAVTYGIGLIFILLYPLVAWSNRKKQEALMAGTAVQVGPDQFPEIHESVHRLSRQLQLAKPPSVFVYESNEQNAAAAKLRGKNMVLLTDDMVWGAETTGDPKVLEFVIAHELAHHRLGHTKFFRSKIASAYKKLSRMDEFSCDAVAAAAVADMNSSAKAITMLAVGPQLLPKVNLKALITQAQFVVDNKQSRKAESSMTHPMIVRRFARVIGMEMKC